MTIPDEALRAAQEATEGGFGITDDYMRAALTAALPFLQGVKVKDLRWKGPDSIGEYHSLNGLWGYIIRCGNGNGYWLTEIGQYYPTPEAAKAAAQADYEARILSAIEFLVCKTCNGHGLVGGLIPWGDGEVDSVCEPCPDCAPSPRAQALEEIISGNLSAISSQPVADGWLPVGNDTPKDTVVLMTWNYQGNWEYEAGLYGSTRGGWLHGQASHWRPLPASPEVSE